MSFWDRLVESLRDIGTAIGEWTPKIIGALIIKTIGSGCTMLSIPNTYTHIIIGIIIIIAVLIDGLRNGTPKWLFDRLR